MGKKDVFLTEINKKAGNFPSQRPFRVQTEQRVFNMQRDTILKIFIEFTVPKNTRRDTHKTAFTITRNIKNPIFANSRTVPKRPKIFSQ